MQPSVPDGLVAQYEHCRNHVLVSTQSQDVGVSPFGGATICRILDENRVVVAVGEAYCSEEDQYVKKIGRDISLGRALKEYNGTAGS